MLIIIIILVLVILSCLLIYFSSKWKSKRPLWSNILFTIGTSIFSSLIIFILLNQTLKQIEIKKRKRIEQCAFKILRNPVTNHLEFLFRLSNNSGQDVNISVLSEFNDDYFDKLSKFDVYKQSNYIPQKPWFFIIKNKLTRFYNSIDKILSTYIFFLDDKDILLLEDLKKSATFFPPSDMFILTKEYYKNENDNSFRRPFRQEIMVDFKQHISNLIKFVQIYNSKVEKNKIDEIQAGSSK